MDKSNALTTQTIDGIGVSAYLPRQLEQITLEEALRRWPTPKGEERVIIGKPGDINPLSGGYIGIQTIPQEAIAVVPGKVYLKNNIPHLPLTFYF